MTHDPKRSSPRPPPGSPPPLDSQQPQHGQHGQYPQQSHVEYTPHGQYPQQPQYAQAAQHPQSLQYPQAAEYPQAALQAQQPQAAQYPQFPQHAPYLQQGQHPQPARHNPWAQHDSRVQHDPRAQHDPHGQHAAYPPHSPYAQPSGQPHHDASPSPMTYSGAQAPRPYDYWSQPAPPPPAPAEPAASGRAIAHADATRGVSQRVRFIRLTYLHLLGAIAAFAGLLHLLMTQPVLLARVSAPLVRFALAGRWNWGVVLAVFMAVSWIADRWAGRAESRAVQYAGLGFYVIAEALIFVPLLAIVEWKTQAILARGGGDPHIVRDAAYVTLGVFSALTLSVFFTRKDFSFLGSGLAMASGAALSLIVLSLTFGFSLGLAFSVGMVLLAAGYILFQTSQVLAHADPRRHVAAALALFSSVALLFWYVIRIFLRARE